MGVRQDDGSGSSARMSVTPGVTLSNVPGSPGEHLAGASFTYSSDIRGGPAWPPRRTTPPGGHAGPPLHPLRLSQSSMPTLRSCRCPQGAMLRRWRTGNASVSGGSCPSEGRAAMKSPRYSAAPD